ncbi:NYN domain-containing protein [Candidatus Azambacteria bacterium]|nr:NYN domain-containing protein [Candidatus Azambacteria bacterium]
MYKEKNNIAFIDGQNLYFGTTKCNNCAQKLGLQIKDINLSNCTCRKAWKVDLSKFRIYLSENYSIREAYYVLGYLDEKNDNLYREIQKAGFIVLFKEHHVKLRSDKRGNVDTDIVFEIMKNVVENNFNKIILVSGDGDYKKLVYYLVERNKFCKILFPNKQFASSLYNALGSEYFDYLENIKTYIKQKEKGS